MRIEETVALVTGSNRGIGRAFVDELVRRGASRVYAGVRALSNADSLVATHGQKVVPVRLDVTENDQIAAAASAVGDIHLLVNNAGFQTGLGPIINCDLDDLRRQLEINAVSPLALAKAFFPALERTMGTIVNVNSIVSYSSLPGLGLYSASKAAAHSLTQALRAELASHGVRVMGVYPGPIDTDMSRDFDMEKETPANVALATLDALEQDLDDVHPDPHAVQWHEQWLADSKAYERWLANMAG